ncbi:MAG: SPASM domain-containing protein [Egibacteraceae bacterium]
MALGQAQDLRVQLSSDDFPVSAADANDPKLRDNDQPNCGAGFETCYVSPRGQLLGCVTIPQIDFGDLHTRPFLEVWNSRQAAAYRHRAAATDQRRLCDALCSQVVDPATSLPLMTLSPLPRRPR